MFDNNTSDLHLFGSVRVIDPDLAEASCEFDAAIDRDWFRAHPGARTRTRPASPLERAAFGLAEGSGTRVRLTRDGAQTRIFLLPEG